MKRKKKKKLKQKLSITIDEENIKRIKKLLKKGNFRSLSHIVEFAIIKLLKESKNKKYSGLL